MVGDFNLIRKPENRNRPGGDDNEMLLFIEAISALGLIELPLHGKKYTWINKQTPPLLERLDWFFTSSSWTTLYPDTSVSSLIMPTSDHWPRYPLPYPKDRLSDLRIFGFNIPPSCL